MSPHHLARRRVPTEVANVVVAVRLTASEKASLDAAATARGCRTSDLLRAWVQLAGGGILRAVREPDPGERVGLSASATVASSAQWLVDLLHQGAAGEALQRAIADLERLLEGTLPRSPRPLFAVRSEVAKPAPSASRKKTLPLGRWVRVWIGRGVAHTVRAGDLGHTVCGCAVQRPRWRSAPTEALDCGSCARMRTSLTSPGERDPALPTDASVPCPRCNARAGAPCVEGRGVAVPVVHVERSRLAARQLLLCGPQP